MGFQGRIGFIAVCEASWPGVARRQVTFLAPPRKVTQRRGAASREQGSRLRDATDRESVPDAGTQCQSPPTGSHLASQGTAPPSGVAPLCCSLGINLGRGLELGGCGTRASRSDSPRRKPPIQVPDRGSPEGELKPKSPGASRHPLYQGGNKGSPSDQAPLDKGGGWGDLLFGFVFYPSACPQPEGGGRNSAVLQGQALLKSRFLLGGCLPVIHHKTPTHFQLVF